MHGLDWNDPTMGMAGMYLPPSAPNHIAVKFTGRPVPPAAWSNGMLLPHCVKWGHVQAPSHGPTSAPAPAAVSLCLKREGVAVGQFVLRWEE